MSKVFYRPESKISLFCSMGIDNLESKRYRILQRLFSNVNSLLSDKISKTTFNR